MSDTEGNSNSRPLPNLGGRKRPVNGLDAAKIVRRYLSAIDAAKPGRSVRRTIEAVASRIVKIDELLVSADPLSRLLLTQERIDLHAEHVRLTTTTAGSVEDFEAEFVKVARAFGDRAGVTYAAWRQVGVEAAVLERAGIHRTRPPQPRAERPAPASPVRNPAAPPTPATSPQPAEPAAATEVADTLPENERPVAAPATEPTGETLWEVTAEDIGTPAAANGTGAHDSPPMRRKRIAEPPARG